MKTTLNFDDALLARAKSAAVREGTTVTRLVEEGLRLRLRGRAGRSHAARPARLPTFKGGGGLRPGIDPSSNRSLYDALDEE